MKHAASILGLCLALTVSNGCKDPAPSASQTVPSGNKKTVNAPEPSAKSDKYGESQLKKLRTEFESMLSSVELSDEQQSAMEELHSDFTNQARAWFEENGPTITKIQRKALMAGKKRDLSTLKKMEGSGEKATVTRLVNEQRDMLNNHRIDIEKQLPRDQKRKWQAKVITNNLLEFLERLELSKEQIEAIENLAPQAISRLKRDQLENWRGYGTSILEKLFESKVLAEQQRTTFEEMKKRTRTRMLTWSDRFF